jgi:serine/threonine-protein kinase
MSRPTDNGSRPQAELEQAATLDGSGADTLRDLAQSASRSGEKTGPGDTAKVDVSGQRYEMLEVLGRGGMGEVRKAFDPRLGRHVALKIMRNASPDLARRLVKEARAQARVDHPHICKVFGVGELDGQPFIALQFVDGKTLSDLAPEMTRTQRVSVMQKVCEALHAAHKQGLVHRDIKPANILIEKNDAGQYVPYVADFGVAREIEGPAMTAIGAAIGTPLYMAPEQARGETDKLDRRTDVYSLGATLYELLARRPPFQADSSLGVILKVLHEDARPLRALDPSIPADLETIVGKAMEKDPERRYDSARALAEDLQRFLDGDPIQARPTSLSYRLAKRARKHLGLVITASAAFVIAVGLGAYALHERRTSAIRERLAQEFGVEAERIAAIARDAMLLPLHDLGRERAQIRARMAAVEARMRAQGAVAAGPGHLALGHGYLALERWDDALRELEAASATGYHSPELAYALGLAHGKLYQKALAALTKTDDQAFNAAERQRIEQAHREPALRYLREVAAREGGLSHGVDTPEYVEGLIALYEERYEDALRLARQAFERSPSLFEARTLEGDIQLTAGKQTYLKGNGEGALAAFQRAGDAYHAAVELARSSATALAGDCFRLLEIVDVQVEQNVSPDAAVKGELAACSAAQVARPDDAGLVTAQARAWELFSRYQSVHSADPTHAFDEAVKLGEAALQIDAREARAHQVLAATYWVMAEHRLYKGGDPLPMLDRAVEHGKRALELDPTSLVTYVRLSNVFITWGDHDAGHGRNPRASYEQAIHYAQQAQKRFAGGVDSLNALGIAWASLATWNGEHGIDPIPSLERAIATYRQMMVSNPMSVFSFTNLCEASETWAEQLMRLGEDPRDKLAQAIIACKQGIEYDARANGEGNDSIGPLNLGNGYLLQARWQLEHSMDPTTSLELARKELTRALAIDDDPEMRIGLAILGTLSGRWAQAHGRDPAQDFLAAESPLRKALLADEQNPKLVRALAEVLRWRAESLAQRKRPAAAPLREGLTLIARAEALNPDDAATLVIEGALQLVAARTAPGTAERAAAMASAHSALDRAVRINRFLECEVRELLASRQ